MAETVVEHAAPNLPIEPDALAVVVRDGDARYRVQTNHHVVASETRWGMVWELLFGVLFFAPVLGMAVGAGLAGLMARVERMGVDEDFQRQVRDMLQPGTSALFMVVEEVTPETAVEAVSRYGGRVVTSSLCERSERALQERLHGAGPSPASL